MRHRFHSMCPYFAMFPEAFAERWIGALSKPGEVVLDPFSGRGTAPFQALLMDRIGIGADINPVAACLNKAKLESPSRKTAETRLRDLERGYHQEDWLGRAKRMDEFFKLAYDPQVLSNLLYLRSSLNWQLRRSDALMSALALGALHGEMSSRRYLSNQMPRTISTKPSYSLKYWRERQLTPPERDVFAVLADAISYRYASLVPSRRGRAFFGDMRDLPRRWRGPLASLIITSPPYGALTSYEEDQWLRLWFLGGRDRPQKGRVSRDDRYQRGEDYWNFIGDFWRVVSCVLKPSGHVVVRLGATTVVAEELIRQLVGSFILSPRRLELVETGISDIRRRQTDSFRPGSRGCRVEIDIHAVMQ